MSEILWFLLAVLFCGLAIQFAVIGLRIRKRGHAHEVLLNRVMRLRMYKMLKFLGASPDEYLSVVPAADINQQIHRCIHCRTTEICDNCLRDGKRIVNMNFCPNHRSLTEHSKTVHLHRLV